VGLAGDGEGGVGDGEGEVFGHLVFVDDLADGDTDVVGPGECPGGDPGEGVLGGPQQVFAFAGPLGRQERASTTCGGNIARFASVSCLTLPPSR
jgi:hypothetical protein